MRAEVLQAIALVAGLHAAGPLVSPPTVPAGELPGHLGERIQLEARVIDVEPGETITRVTLEDATGHVTALARGPLPPLGATVRVLGDAAAGREGPVLWIDGSFDVLDRRDRAPIPLAQLLSEAPDRAGETLAVVGTWDADGRHLEGDAGTLPVRVQTAQPPDEGRILAWGELRYDAATAGYRFDAVGWERWQRTP